VTEQRCPECGRPFDPEYLRAILAGAPAPIPVWEAEHPDAVVRFIQVCLLTWFMPTWFGRRFPRHYETASALRFHWTVVAVVLIGYATCLVPAFGLVGLLVVIFPGAFVILGVLACELVIAGTADHCLFPDSIRGSARRAGVSDSMEGLVGFFRSFLLLQALILGVGALLDILPGWKVSQAFYVVAIVVVPVWWWCALASAIAVQRAPTLARVKAIAIGSVFAGLAMLGAFAFFGTVI